MACGADKVQSYVGQLANPANRANVAKASGTENIRWIEPGMAVTMDYRGDRLNVNLSGNGRINSFNCG